MSEAQALEIPSQPSRNPYTERHYFAWLAGFIPALVFAGFARTYYLNSVFGAPSLSTFLHIHGAVMTGWIFLFSVQTFLITRRHAQLHMLLGILGTGYALLVVIMGSTATILAARREVLAHSKSVSGFLTVLALELTQMSLFAVMVAAGFKFRKRTGHHKRLMLLATVCMLQNPMVRLLTLIGVEHNLVILNIWALVVIAIVLLDSVRNHRVHPAFKLGATLTICSLYLAYFASLTSVWQRFAADVVR